MQIKKYKGKFAFWELKGIGWIDGLKIMSLERPCKDTKSCVCVCTCGNICVCVWSVYSSLENIDIQSIK